MPYLIGIDGGGTRTTLALADEHGAEVARHAGPAGLVDPRRPEHAAERLVQLVRELFAHAGVPGPAAALCAGLAGAGNAEEREVVHSVLASAGVTERVWICSDGETALHGALAGEPGILLVAGTGSIAYALGEDGRVERCGGWGMVVGDEGSGYALGRAALTAALRAVDGRGPETALRAAVLRTLGVDEPDAVPPWAGRAEKAEIAGLSRLVLQLAAADDPVAGKIVRAAAEGLAEHASALLRRLEPWSGAVPVVLHGGVAGDPVYRRFAGQALAAADQRLRLREAAADAVAGAVQMARRMLRAAP